MKAVGLLIALFVMVVGTVGLFTPDSLIAVGRYVVTPIGLYAVAALRVAMGLLLMMVARISRAPKTLRAVGAVVIVAGLTTPLFGVERVRAMLDWEATQGTALIRTVAGLLLAGGAFLAFAVAAGRRPA
jgi:hypothetical protein